MKVSVVIKTRDEADRLRLTLTSLAGQTHPAEVVVVNDGSTDHTPAVLAEMATVLPLRVVTHFHSQGRSAAANAGARAATGELLVFLDGDTLASPECVAGHVAVHEAAERLVARGECRHLRCTRFFQNPETGEPRLGEESRVAKMGADFARQLVTRQQIREDFAAVARRGELGLYPGVGPRRLAEVEIDALTRHPELGVLWAAASAQNQSIRRRDFLEAGGFDERLTINEHRELALRLTDRGARMAFVPEARTFHLTHRTGWRDPLADPEWERLFYARHPLPAVKLLSVFWATLADGSAVPPEGRIESLVELDAVARGLDGRDPNRVRRFHARLPALPEVGGLESLTARGET